MHIQLAKHIYSTGKLTVLHVPAYFTWAKQVRAVQVFPLFIKKIKPVGQLEDISEHIQHWQKKEHVTSLYGQLSEME